MNKIYKKLIIGEKRTTPKVSVKYLEKEKAVIEFLRKHNFLEANSLEITNIECENKNGNCTTHNLKMRKCNRIRDFTREGIVFYPANDGGS